MDDQFENNQSVDLSGMMAPPKVISESSGYYQTETKSSLTQFLIDHSGGLIRDKHAAFVVMLVVVIVITIISILIVTLGGASQGSSVPMSKILQATPPTGPAGTGQSF